MLFAAKYMPQQGQMTIGFPTTRSVPRKDAAFAGSKRRKTMKETIKYPIPMPQKPKEEDQAKREPQEEANHTPKRNRIRVKIKRCKDPSVVSEQWHRYFYIYPHQASRIRMQQNIKEGIAFAKESVSYRMPMPVLRIEKLPNKDEFPVCPRCNIMLEREWMIYCNQCGQCLDWSMLNQARIDIKHRK